MNFPPMMTEGSSRAFKFASSLPALGWEPVVVAFHSVSGPELEEFPFDVHYVGQELSLQDFGAEQLSRCVHGLRQKKLSFPRLGGNVRSNAGAGENGWEKKARTVAEQVLHDNPDIEMIYAQAPPFAPHRIALELSGKYHRPVMFDCIGPFAVDKLEMTIMHSGHSVTMPSRELKEFFLRKYRGKLSHDDISIIKNCYDPEALQALGIGHEAGALMRWVFHIGTTNGSDLKHFFYGLSAFVKSQLAVKGIFSFAFTGSGYDSAMRYLKKYGLEDLVEAGPVCSHREELELCLRADIFCVVLGGSRGTEIFVPERLYDVLGMNASLAGVLPDGLARQLILEAGGRTASIGNSTEIAGLLQDTLHLWYSGQLPAVADAAVSNYHIRSSMQEFLREMAARLPLV